jgi:hypothetical protein
VLLVEWGLGNTQDIVMEWLMKIMGYVSAEQP